MGSNVDPDSAADPGRFGVASWSAGPPFIIAASA
jgi:hypothetical protein